NQGLADLALARESATVNSPLYATAGPILATIPPFVWAYYWYDNKKLASLGLWLATTLAILATGQKAPAAIWVFALVLTMGLFAKQKFIRTLLVALCVGSVSIGLLLWLIAIQNNLGVEQIEVILTAFRNRMFFAGPRALQGYLDFFPALHPFIGLNAGTPAADQLVYNFANPSSQIQG